MNPAEHKDIKDLAKRQLEIEQLQDIDIGVGYSSDKVLARRYNTTRKTIWAWARDPKNSFPTPVKLSANMTRWNNAEIHANENVLITAGKS